MLLALNHFLLTGVLTVLPEIAVQTPPGGLVCPPPSDIVNALAARERIRATAGPPWRLHYGEMTGPAPKRLQMELRSPDGTVRLRRALPIEPAPCKEVAEVMAVIAQRFFTEIGWSSGQPLPPALGAPAPPAPVALPKGDEAKVPLFRLSVGALAGGFRSSTLATMADARVRLAGSFVLAAGLVTPRSRAETIGGEGTARLREWSTRLFIGVGRPLSQ